MVPLLHRPLAPHLMPLDPCVAPWSSGGHYPNKTLWMQCVLPWQLRHHPVAVTHFTNSVAPLLSPAPNVVTIHDMTLWLFPEHHYWRRLVAMRPVIPLVARQASAIITVSESAKRDIVRVLGVAPNKVHVVYEAAAPAFRQLPPGPAVKSVSQRYQLPPHFILYVGTIEPRKNLVRLLEAFAALRQRQGVPHALVVVSACGWKMDSFFAAIERLGLADAVLLLRDVPQDDLVALYNLADLFAFPSLYEGFGLPVVEAMACGTPVVTSSSSSLGEIAAGAAQFVEPSSTSSIAEGLWSVLSDADRRATLRERGLHRARTFSWQRAAEQTRALYEQVVAQAG